MRKIAKLEIENGKVKVAKFPLVYKNASGEKLMVVYSNHSETYKLIDTFKGDNEGTYNADNEINMCEGNGFKKVHA